MARAPSRFDRKKPSLQQQARVLVLCEDSKSSRTYLQDAADYFPDDENAKRMYNRINEIINIVELLNDDVLVLFINKV